MPDKQPTNKSLADLTHDENGKLYTYQNVATDETGNVIKDETGQPVISGTNTNYTGGDLTQASKSAKGHPYLQYKHEYQTQNPKSDYIDNYLNLPFAQALGNTKDNYPERLDNEYESKVNRYAAQQVFKNNPKLKNESRGEYLDRLARYTDETGATRTSLPLENILHQYKNDSKDTKENIWRRSLEGIKRLTLDAIDGKNDNLLIQHIVNDKNLSRLEKEEALKQYVNHPILSTVQEGMNVISPPLDLLYNSTTGAAYTNAEGEKGYTPLSALSGEVPANEAPIEYRIMADPLNVMFPLVEGLEVGSKIGNAATRAGKALGTEEGLLSRIPVPTRNSAPIDLADMSFEDKLFAARRGNKEAQDLFSSYGLGWDENPVKYRYANQDEIDKILNHDVYKNSKIDIREANNPTGFNIDTQPFKVTFKEHPDFDYQLRKSRIRPVGTDEFRIEHYSLDDIAKIEKYNQETGQMETIYNGTDFINDNENQIHKEIGRLQSQVDKMKAEEAAVEEQNKETMRAYKWGEITAEEYKKRYVPVDIDTRATLEKQIRELKVKKDIVNTPQKNILTSESQLGNNISTGGTNTKGVFEVGDKYVARKSAHGYDDASRLVNYTDKLESPRIMKTHQVTELNGSVYQVQDKATGIPYTELTPEQLRNIPQEQINNFWRDIAELKKNGLNIDISGGKANIMYDPDKGFQFIDLGIGEMPEANEIRDITKIPSRHERSFRIKQSEVLSEISSPEGRRRLQNYINNNKHLQDLNLTPDQIIRDFRDTFYKVDLDEANGYNHYKFGYDKPSIVALGNNHDDYSARQVIEHEFAHLFQRGKEIEGVDDILANIKLDRQKIQEYTPAKTNELLDPERKVLKSNKSAAQYWLDGEGRGMEKAAFAAEIRQNMLEEGIMNRRYQIITPEMLKKHFKFYNDKLKGRYNLRLYNIMSTDDKNFELLAEALNKMPAVLPFAGAAALAKSKQSTQEYKNGGRVKGTKNKYSLKNK